MLPTFFSLMPLRQELSGAFAKLMPKTQTNPYVKVALASGERRGPTSAADVRR